MNTFSTPPRALLKRGPDFYARPGSISPCGLSVFCVLVTFEVVLFDLLSLFSAPASATSPCGLDLFLLSNLTLVVRSRDFQDDAPPDFLLFLPLPPRSSRIQKCGTFG